MTKTNEMSLNFSGLTHDHSVWSTDAPDEENTCSTIAILRRHPMYDCLVLVKKYRECLKGYSLEFPTNKINNDESSEVSEPDSQQELQDENSPSQTTNRLRNCSRRRLVSRFLDGDDPIYQSVGGCVAMGHNEGDHNVATAGVQSQGVVHPISTQLDDDLAQSSGELVHVPVNGLLDRLKNYTESGLAVDSRVYAFAMGLKTAERILTTGSMREIQETPI